MMRDPVISLLSGTLFGGGLAISGMMDPKRVRDFLDIAGSWDPTLAFVMGGAVVVMALAWFLQKRLARPVLADSFSLPKTNPIDRKLVGGAVLFGLGWGLAGLCPGPAIGAVIVEPLAGGVFLAALALGMVVHRKAMG